MRGRGTWLLVLTLAAAAAFAAVAQETSERRERRDRDGRRERRDERSDGAGRRDPRDGPAPQPGPATPSGENGPATQSSQPVPSGAQPSRGAPLPEKYNVLLQRSIFARGGYAARTTQPATQSAPSAPPMTPQQQVLLMGVLCPDEQFVAFAENRATGQVMILHQGDEVAQGRVAAITLDSLTFVQGDREREIRVGQNLAGETVAPGATTMSTAGTSSATTPPASPAEAAILEKLRAARRQSGGQ